MIITTTLIPDYPPASVSVGTGTEISTTFSGISTPVGGEVLQIVTLLSQPGPPGSGLSVAEQVAAGMTVSIIGSGTIDGAGVVTWDTETIDRIAALVALGWPLTHIVINYVTPTGAGSLTAANGSVTPTAQDATLTGTLNAANASTTQTVTVADLTGTLTASDAEATPTATAAELETYIENALNADDASTTPTATVAALVGALTASDAATTPSATVATLDEVVSGPSPVWAFEFEESAATLAGNGNKSYESVSGTTYVTLNASSQIVDSSLGDRALELVNATHTGLTPTAQPILCPPDAAWSVEFVVNLAAFTDQYPAIAALKSGVASNPLLLGVSNQAGYYGLYWGSNSTFAKQRTGTVVGDANAFLSTWVHGVLTYNGAGSTTGTNYAVYLQGEAKAKTSVAGFAATTDTTILGMTTGTTSQWRGQIGFIRTYDVELSSEQAATLAQASGVLGNSLAAANASATPTATVATLVGTLAAANASTTPTAGSAELLGDVDFMADDASTTPTATTASLVGTLTAANASTTPTATAGNLAASGDVLNESFGTDLGAFTVNAGTVPVSGGVATFTTGDKIVAPCVISKGFYLETHMVIDTIGTLTIKLNSSGTDSTSDGYDFSFAHLFDGEEGEFSVLSSAHLFPTTQYEELGLLFDSAANLIRIEFGADDVVDIYVGGVLVKTQFDNLTDSFSHIWVMGGDGTNNLHDIKVAPL